MDDYRLLSSFILNPDGSWALLRQITFSGMTMNPGLNLREGLPFGGIDIARLLNKAAERNPKLVRTWRQETNMASSGLNFLNTENEEVNRLRQENQRLKLELNILLGAPAWPA